MAPKTKGSGISLGTSTNLSDTPNMPIPLTESSSAAAGNMNVNRKKQKRRQKQAARQAVTNDDAQYAHGTVDSPYFSNEDLPKIHDLPDPSLPTNADASYDTDPARGRRDYGDSRSQSGGEENYDPATRVPNGSLTNGTSGQNKKKKKSKGMEPPMHGDYVQQMPPPRPISEDALRSVSRNIKEGSIWDTNGPEERSRIKAFWLGLSEKERKDLVNIEKSHVLQKMKEQQKHSCSCTVCGRKRTAIEEELEVLLKDPRIWADPTTDPPSDRLPSSMTAGIPPRRRIQELPDDEDGDFEDDELDDDGDYNSNSEEYGDDEDEDDDYISDAEDIPSNIASDFFQFGNSLTVKADGILTVADDLLKNDGQKFIDMMEQLAERRMQREEDARYNASHYGSHPSMSPQHNHPTHAGQQPLDDEDYDEEEDEDYDDEEGDYDDEEDEMDTMTEDQRMEEGRRMFQIFAARMFEQRVVTAYREKVAWERQQALINEQEQDAAGPSEAKKAKNAEKKKRQRIAAKEAKAQKEAAKEEEKQRREAAAREVEEKKREEQKLKQEEQRKKKEAERKALEDKKRKKEAEIQKKLEAERERQQEQERKQRELKAEEKRRKEEVDRKKREEREAKENEAREKKAQEDRERKEREAQLTTDKGAQDKRRKDEQFGKASVPPPTMIALPPGIKSRNSQDSPLAKVATPALPKAPTPSRSKEPPSRRTSTPLTPERTPQVKSHTPPMPSVQQSVQPPGQPSSRQQQPYHGPYAPQMSPVHSVAPLGAQNLYGQPTGGAPPMSQNGHPAASSQMPPSIMQRPPQPQQMAMLQSHGASQPIGLQARQGIQGAAQAIGPPGPQAQQRPRGAFPDMSPGLFGQQAPVSNSTGTQPGYGTARDMAPPPATHSRQASNQFDGLSLDTQSAASAVPPPPIGRPAPIKRPASVNKSRNLSGERPKSLTAKSDIDDLSNHLGSSALLDDTDEPLPSSVSDNRRSSAAPGSMRSASSVIGSPFEPVQSPFSSFSSGGRAPGDSWGRAPSSHFGPPGMPPPVHSHPQAPGWGGLGVGSTPHSGATSGGGWNPSLSASSQGHPFSLPTHHRTSGGNPRAVIVRMFAVQACKTLSSQSTGIDNSGFFDFSDIVRQTVESGRQMHVEPGIQLSEIRNILDTEGDAHNGGGMFQVSIGDMKMGSGGRTLVRWVPDFHQRQGPGMSELGSPIADARLPNLGGLGRL